MMTKVAIVKLDSDFEECVKVSVCGKTLTCFMQYGDIIVKEGDVWLADFFGEIFNDFVVEETNLGLGLHRVGGDFSYVAVGKISEDKLDCGEVVFVRDYFLNEFHFLNGKKVAWSIDRLEIDFIEKI